MDTQTLPNNQPATVYVQMPAINGLFRIDAAQMDMVLSDRNSEIIHKAIEDYFGYNKGHLRNKCRLRRLVFARHLSIYLHTKATDYTLTYIARLYDRDHTTAIHGRDAIKNCLNFRHDTPEKEIIQDFFTQYGF
jgi:chromosomal replication initiation ATPase DnaA